MIGSRQSESGAVATCATEQPTLSEPSATRRSEPPPLLWPKKLLETGGSEQSMISHAPAAHQVGTVRRAPDALSPRFISLGSASLAVERRSTTALAKCFARECMVVALRKPRKTAISNEALFSILH